MKESFPPEKKISLLFLVASLFVFFVSCTDSEPKMISGTSYVIFDFKDTESLPSQRLSVFVEASSDVRRVSRILVSSRESSYEWNCENPLVFSEDKRKWTGYTDFASPENVPLPQGIYDVRYFDAEERISDVIVTVMYDKDILSMTSGEAATDLSGKFNEKIAVYDRNRTLIFFDGRKDSWKSDEDVFSSLEDAESLRRVLVLFSENSICLLPPVFRKTAENAESS